MEEKIKDDEYLYNFKFNRRNEKKIKEIMKNNILTLRKKNNINKNISRIKDNNLSIYSPVEKNYYLSYSSFEIPSILNEYYNNLKNKNIFLYHSINNEEQITTKFCIDKNNLTKFILFQLNYYIEYMLNNYETNIDNMKNFFDNNTVQKLINILYEYSNNNNIRQSKNTNDNEIIIYNICKILIKLTDISNYYTSLIINNHNNVQLLILSLKHYFKINQILGNNLLIIIYNCYLENKNMFLNKFNNLILFILENLSNFQNNPIENIIQSDFLFHIIDFLSDLLNELTFNVYMNNPYINNCILLMINIFLNYDNENIKFVSIKCLIRLLHCIDENTIVKINNFQNLILSLLNYLNIEKKDIYIIIKVLEIISLFTYLYEIDLFVNNDLIDAINQILIHYVIHKEQYKTILLTNKNVEKEFNIIIENISIILLNCCLSEKVYNYIVYNTSIVKNIIIIMNSYLIEISTLKNLYNFLNELTNSEDCFISLIIANFLEIGIIQSLNKFIDMRNYEVIFIILNFAFKSLEYGNIFIDKNLENNRCSKINFVKVFLEKKGFKDILNLIISPDFGNNKCSDIAKNIKEIFF